MRHAFLLALLVVFGCEAEISHKVWITPVRRGAMNLKSPSSVHPAERSQWVTFRCDDQDWTPRVGVFPPRIDIGVFVRRGEVMPYPHFSCVVEPSSVKQ